MTREQLCFHIDTKSSSMPTVRFLEVDIRSSHRYCPFCQVVDLDIAYTRVYMRERSTPANALSIDARMPDTCLTHFLGLAYDAEDHENRGCIEEKGRCVRGLEPYAGLPDEELMSLSGQDADAFGEIYRRFKPELTAFVRSRLRGDEMRAEDVVSQIFSNAFRSRRRYREGNVRGWLYQITRNAVTDEFRRARPVIPIEDFNDLVDREQGTLEQMTAREAAEELRRMVATLPPPQDEILNLRMAGLTVPQIAKRLGISQEAARSSMYRAFRKLRGELRP